MAREFTKRRQENGLWCIVDYFTSEEPPQERNQNIGEMTIMRSDGKNLARISGGPIIAYFNEEILADEYCKFKNEQINGIK